MKPVLLGLALTCTVFAAWAANGADSLSGSLFTIEYRAPDEALARESLAILEKALGEFTPRLPAGNAPIRVVLCRSLQEFRGLAGAYGRARVGGIARSREGLIVVKAPYLLPQGQDYRGMLRHELIHVLLARNTNEANVPRWFDEGIAMVISGELRWESGLRIARMYAVHRLIPYPELNMAFAPLGDEGTFGDAYAQALSITQFLVKRIGDDRFWDLVLAMKEMPFEEALRIHAELSPADLYDAWRRSLWKVALIASLVSGFSAFQLMVVLLLIAYVRRGRRNRKILDRWEEEERDPGPYTWDEIVDEPYPWEEDDDR